MEVYLYIVHRSTLIIFTFLSERARARSIGLVDKVIDETVSFTE